MDTASLYYLGVTIGLFAIFAVIVVRVMRPGRKEKMESPKFKMLKDDE